MPKVSPRSLAADSFYFLLKHCSKKVPKVSKIGQIYSYFKCWGNGNVTILSQNGTRTVPNPNVYKLLVYWGSDKLRVGTSNNLKMKLPAIKILKQTKF